MKKDEVFLALYKEYESILRNKGLDCKEVEDKSDDLTANRLRVCRNNRNYLSHTNDAGFIEISDKQIKFLKDRVDELKSEEDILKKHIKNAAQTICSEKDKCSDVCAKFAKLKTTDLVMISSENNYGLVNIFDTSIKALESKTTKMSTLKPNKKGFSFEKPDTLMSNIPKDTIIICTSDGTENGKLLGVMYP